MSHRLRTASLLVACASALGGCATLDAWGYRPSSLSGTPKGKLALMIAPLPAGSAQEASTVYAAAARADKELGPILATTCGVATPVQPGDGREAALAAAAVPIIAAVAQLGFEAFVDHQQRKVDAIVEAAKAEYAITAAVRPGAGGLEDAKCLVLVRYTEDEKKGVQPQLTSVLQLRRHDPGAGGRTRVISLRPVYVRALSAVAQTRDGDKPGVSLSFALSIKAVAQEPDSPVARLVPAGEATTTVPELVLKPEGSVACTGRDCKESDLLPYPTDHGTLSVTMAVAERGRTGFDDKATSAELAALKAALGPAIGEAVKTKLAPE